MGGIVTLNDAVENDRARELDRMRHLVDVYGRALNRIVENGEDQYCVEVALTAFKEVEDE